MFVRKPALKMKLYANDSKIEFDPGFTSVQQTILNCFSAIIKSAEGLPRVEVELFPFPEYKKFILRSVRQDEAFVDGFIRRAIIVYEANRIGPQK